MIVLPLNPEGLNDLTARISRGLSEISTQGLPVEITETLIIARTEMESIPKVIEDLARAEQTFEALAKTMDSLQELAAEAAILPEHDQKGRDRCDAEFVKKAGIVAKIAGNNDYNGPELRLLSRPQALAAKTALRHLLPAKDRMAENLAEQVKNINEAIKATLYFLETTARAFPEAMSSVTSIVESEKGIRLH